MRAGRYELRHEKVRVASELQRRMRGDGVSCLPVRSRPKVEIECVGNASSALERIRAGHVACIILDLEISGGSGLATFDQIFSGATHLPILILCSEDSETAARQAVERSAYDYILKSHLQDFRLRRIVRAMLDKKAGKDMAYLRQQCAEATLSRSGEAVVVSDSNGCVTDMNVAAESLTGWSRADASGRRLNDVLRIDNTDKYQEDAGDTALSGSADNKYADLTGNCMLYRRDGPEIGIQNSTVPTLDREGKVTGMVSIFHDVGAARTKTLELSHLAQHDFMTDLPNRVLLNDRIAQAIAFARRYTKKLAVMFVDLDHFKKINDTYGHAVGDKLLQLVASRIVSCVRRSDTVSRQGGDEFIVLLSEVSHAEDAVFIARKILTALAAPYSIDEKHLWVSASIGVSTYSGDGKDVETLIHNADTALYDAKKLGRNNYQFFRADMQLRVLEWKSLQGSLRRALGRNEFVLHYQPKINLKTAEVSGGEALLRWNHPDRGLISPAQFVPIAEESGLIVPIGQWVLLEACRQARARLNAGLPPVRTAVNVSALQFMDKDFLSAVEAALMITGIHPYHLELELTQTVLMRDADSAMKTLSALKAVGVQLAVDDFGTGYSSFSYLRRFPLDCLKVDRSFIKELGADSNNSANLSAMINLGKSLNHRVVAEGVETKEQLHFLQKQECSEGQGFYFSHRVIAEKFAEFLESGVREPDVH